MKKIYLFLLVSSLGLWNLNAQNSNQEQSSTQSAASASSDNSPGVAANSGSVQSDASDPVLMRLYSKGAVYGQFDPAKEDLTKRSENAKHFLEPDGSYTAAITPGTAHYFENGGWRTQSLEIIPTGNSEYPLANLHAANKTWYGNRISSGIKMVRPEGVTFGRFSPKYIQALDGAGAVLGTVSKVNPEANLNTNPAFNTIVKYPAVFPYTNMQVEQFRDHIKTSYTVSQNTFTALPAGTQNIAFVEKVEVPAGVSVEKKRDEEKGLSLVVRQGDKIIMVYTNAYFYDDTTNGHKKTGGLADLDYVLNGNELEFRMMIPAAWFNDTATQYPVVIDPDIYPTVAAWNTGFVTNDCGWHNNEMCVGFGDNWDFFGLFGDNVDVGGFAKFNLTSIPTEACMSDAIVYFYQYTANMPGDRLRFNFGWANFEPVSAYGCMGNNAVNAGLAEVYQSYDVYNCYCNPYWDYNEGSGFYHDMNPSRGLAGRIKLLNASQGYITYGMDMWDHDDDCWYCFGDESNLLWFLGYSSGAPPILRVTYTAPQGQMLTNPIPAGEITCAVSYTSPVVNNTPSNCYANDVPSPVSSASTGNTSHDIWYSFSLSSTQTVNISTCGSTIADSYVSLWSGTTSANLAYIASNDNNGPVCPGSSLASLRQTLPAGNYLVAVEGAGVNTGNLTTYIYISGPVLGTVSNPGPINFCGVTPTGYCDFSPAVTLSGYIGNPVWEWAASATPSTWNTPWVSGATSGTSCFPPKVAVSDANPDRIRVGVSACGTTVYSPAIELRNRYNSAPAGPVTTISAACLSGFTVTSTFSGPTNILGTVDFYRSPTNFGSNCASGTLVAQVPGNGTTTVSTFTVPPGPGVYYYGARYNPGITTNGCSPSFCTPAATVTILANPDPPTTATTNPLPGTVCGGSTITVSGVPSGGVNPGASCGYDFQYSTNNGVTWVGPYSGSSFTTTGTGNSGTSTITVASAAGIAAGQLVTGIGLGANASVAGTYVPGSTTVPLTAANLAYVSGTLTFTTYNLPIVTPSVTGTNNVIVQARRANCNGQCPVSAWGTIGTWSTVLPPSSPTTATKNPNVASICSGSTLTLAGPATGGSAGVGCVIHYQYSQNGGSSWTTTGTSIPSFTGQYISGAFTVNSIQAWRDCSGGSCSSTTPVTIASWNVYPSPQPPTANSAVFNPLPGTVCAGSLVTISVLPSGGNDAACSFEYRYSTTGAAGPWTITTTPSFVIGSGVDQNIIEVRRTNCASGCSYPTAWSSQGIWTGTSGPTLPMDVDQNPITPYACVDLVTPVTLSISAMNDPESGFACDHEYRYSTDNGLTWSAITTSYPSFAAVAGISIVQARRINCASCSGLVGAWQTVASWTIGSPPVGSTVSTAGGNPGPVELGTLTCAGFSETASNDPSNCYGNYYTGATNQASDDIFYRFTTGSTASNVVFSTCGSGFDTWIHLLDASGNQLAENDDNVYPAGAITGCAIAGPESSIQYELAANTTYILVVEGRSSASGTINTSIEVMTPKGTITGPEGSSTVCYGEANVRFSVGDINVIKTNFGSNTVETASAVDLTIGTAIVFSESLGNIIAGTTYYVYGVVNPTVFYLSPNQGGALMTQALATGSIIGSTNTYGYTWTPPAGATITSGQGTNSILVDMGTATSGSVSVAQASACPVTANLILNIKGAPFTVTGGGQVCVASPTTVSIGLSGSETGVSYQLIRDGATNVGLPVAGTGAAISFGTHSTTGTYSVEAIPTGRTCSSLMDNTVLIESGDPLDNFTLSSNSPQCPDPGLVVSISTSETGVSYQLAQIVQANLIGSVVPGTGGSVSFDPVSFPADGLPYTYFVKATDDASGCSIFASSTLSGTINDAPSTTAGLELAMTNYTDQTVVCASVTPINFRIQAAAGGTTYTLLNNGTAVAGACTITSGGSNITFKDISLCGGTTAYNATTVTGIYTARATLTSTGCSVILNDTVLVQPDFAQQPVTANGAPAPRTIRYCENNGSYVEMGITGSTSAVNYDLRAPFARQIIATTFGSASAAPPATRFTTTGAHGLSNGDIVRVNVTPSSGTRGYGLTAGELYYVKLSGWTILSANTLVNTFTLSKTLNGNGISVATTGTNTVSFSAPASAESVTGTGSGLDFTPFQPPLYASALSTVSGGILSVVSYNQGTIYVNTTSPGLAAGNQIIFTQSFGDVVAGTPYYVKSVTTNSMVVSAVSPTGTAATLSSGISAASSDIMMYAPAYVTTYSSTGNVITTGYTHGLAIGTPIKFDMSFGNITAGTVYYVESAPTTTTFTVKTSYSGAAISPGDGSISGPPWSNLFIANSHDVSLATVSAYSGTEITTSANHGLKADMPITFPTAFGAIEADSVYYVADPNPNNGTAIDVITTSSGTALNSATPNLALGTAVVFTQSGITSVTPGVVYYIRATSSTSMQIGSTIGATASISVGTTAGGASMYAPQLNKFTVKTGKGSTALTSGAGTVITAASTSNLWVNQPITFSNSFDAITAGTTYYVLTIPSTTTFTVAATKGGAALGVSGATGTANPLVVNVGSGSASVPIYNSVHRISGGGSTGCSDNMTYGAAIIIKPQPAVTAVSDKTDYCPYETISLTATPSGGSGPGTYNTYAWSGPASFTSTSATPSISPVLTSGMSGDYVVTVTDIYECTVSDTTATLTVNPLPTAYTVTTPSGITSFCEGTAQTISLTGSQSTATYQLLKNTSATGMPGPVTGTDLGFNFSPSQSGVGNYTVVATSNKSCTADMNGSVNIGAVPVATTITSSPASPVCANIVTDIYISNSEAGVKYQLKRNGINTLAPIDGVAATDVSFGNIAWTAGTYTAVGLVPDVQVTGSGTAGLTTVSVASATGIFPGQSVVGTGIGNNAKVSAISGTDITLTVVNNGAVSGTLTFGCLTAMTGSVVVNPVPVSQTFLDQATSTTGPFCEGPARTLVLGAGQAATDYELLRGATSVEVYSSTSTAGYAFAAVTQDGSYTVEATNIYGCQVTMGPIVINPTPDVLPVTGGVTVCEGTSVSFGLAASDAGVSYQLKKDGVSDGLPVAGGAAINWSPTAPGTYNVVANIATCSATMSGTDLVINANPIDKNFTSPLGNGPLCGVSVTMQVIDAQSGINYELFFDGATTSLVEAGPGTPLAFSPDQTAAGAYTVIGTDPATGCSVDMGETVTIAPAPATQSVNGGGPYCFDGTTHTIGLDGSESGVSYQLFRDVTAVGSPVAGTGSAISFSPAQSAVGTYTVKATFGSCTDLTMGGSVVINPIPASFTVTGGGNDCSDAPTGFTVGLNGSASGVNYLLYRDGSPTGETLAGTGSSLTFSNQTLVGNYTVVANGSGCLATMTGSVNITINPSPAVFTVTGSGTVCSGGGSGVAVGLSSSESGFDYQLYNGATPVGSPVAGTGSAISFGSQTSAGTYTAVATHSTTGCSGNMSGSAEIITTTTPNAPVVTPAQNPACGSTVLDAVLSGVGRVYWQNTTANGTSLATESYSETVSTSGTYYFRAANDGCWGPDGSVAVTVNSLPPAPTVTPVGNVCSDAVLQASVGGGYPVYWQGSSPGGTSSVVTVAATGVNTEFTVTVASAAGISFDMLVTGAGIGTGAVVTDIVGNVITLSEANTAAINNNVTFTNPGSPQTVDNSGTYYYRTYDPATGCFSNDASYTVSLSTLTIDAGVSNCMNVDNAVYTVTRLTGATGDSVFNVSNATGLLPGMMVSGSGITPNSIVMSITGVTIRMDQPLTNSITGTPVDFNAFDNKYILLSAAGGVAPYTYSTDGFGLQVANPATSYTSYATGVSGQNTITLATLGSIATGMVVSGTSGLAVNTAVVDLATVAASHTATGGSAGTATFTIDDATGVIPGLTVSGTGIATNARVISVAGLTITVSANNTGNPTGTINFSGAVATLSIANTATVGGTATFTRTSPVFEQPLVTGVLSAQYIVTDANGCDQKQTVDVTPGHPDDIPFKNTAGTATVNCFNFGFNKWITFRDPNNLSHAILSVHDNAQNLGNVRVDLYRDATETMAPILGVCTGYQMAAMRRHFVITPQNQPLAGATVGVRLFFSHDELDSLKVKSMANNLGVNPECEEADDVAAIGDLFVTKYHGPSEDASWANNNLAAGYYKVYDNTLGTSDPMYLAIESDGFNNIFNPGAIYQRHYVEMKASELSEFWIHGSFYGAPLPVEMILLEAEAMENTYIQVRWATSLEINNDGFDVERSTDAQNWSRIGWVDGHDNSTVRNDYHLNDYNVTPGIRYYYRLKQVDNDGQFEYTGIVSAIINDKLTFSVKDFRPNPTMDQTSLIIIASKEQQIKVDMYDVIGRKVIATTHQLNRGANQVDFSLANFASGTYTAVVSSANEVYTKKLVLTR